MALSQPFAGIAFSPFRDGQSPDRGICPGFEQVAEDIARLAPLTDHLRTYGLLGCGLGEKVLAAGSRMRLLLGMWLGPDLRQNRRELDELRRLLDAFDFGTVSAISVGNETLLRGDLTLNQLGAYIAEVRQILAHAGCDAQVTTSEGIAHCTAELSEHIDFLFPTIHPYWDGTAIGDSVDAVLRAVDQLATVTGRPVVISETGWPTGGEARHAAVPSEANLARFVGDFLERIGDREYFYFAAFDEAWKRSLGGEVEAHWGLMTSDRIPKPAVAPLLDHTSR